tara:strand:- start:144 stop:578 length:435 start_codon:yes stop_codon:yes gene_type:complete
VEEETCGVAISEVMKVADFERLNRIPLFPNEVLGVTHHRGRVITVLSLAHMLNNQAGEGTLAPQNIMGDGQNKLIIFSREPRNIAVLADFLLGTAPVAPVVQQSSLRPAFTPAAHEGKIIQRLKVDWIFEYVQRLGSAELESPF